MQVHTDRHKTDETDTLTLPFSLLPSQIHEHTENECKTPKKNSEREEKRCKTDKKSKGTGGN